MLQRAHSVPQGLRNAGFNLIDLPAARGVFHRTLGLNQWMGFARNWGSQQAMRAAVIENAVRVGIPTSAAASGGMGYLIGSELNDLAGEDEQPEKK